MGRSAHHVAPLAPEMRQTTQVLSEAGGHHLRMAIIDLTSADRNCHDLHVDSFGLSVGDVSVGLPSSCTADTVLLRYLELVDLCDGRSLQRRLDDTHVPILAAAVSMEPATVRERLRQLSA
jgi:hypothetical protein